MVIRRICPGLFLADQTAFTFAAAILQSYDIVPVQGETVPKAYNYQDSLIRYDLRPLANE
jgi:hypothetical protein